MKKELSTTYLGLRLKNPLVVAACPLTAEIDTLRRMEELGAAAAVMPSLFEEQITGAGTTAASPQLSSKPADSAQPYRRLDDYNRGPGPYLRQLELAKKAVQIPIIGSLNGTTNAGWTRFARQIQDAGANALELNLYYVAADPNTSGAELEDRYLELVSAVRSAISIPLALKLGPNFTSLANMAQRFAKAGADGLVLFNRFLQPDIDLAAGRVKPQFRFSTPDEIHLPLRWIAILKDRVSLSLAATSGIHHAEELVKVLLAGADVGMVASILYHRGIDAIGTLLGGLESWLERSDFVSVEQIKGALSQKRCHDPAMFERAFYAETIAQTAEGAI